MRARSKGTLFDFPAAANILLRLALAPTYALHSGHVWRRSCIIHVLRQFAWKLCPHKVVPKSSLPENSHRQIGQRSSGSFFGGSFRSTVFGTFISTGPASGRFRLRRRAIGCAASGGVVGLIIAVGGGLCPPPTRWDLMVRIVRMGGVRGARLWMVGLRRRKLLNES